MDTSQGLIQHPGSTLESICRILIPLQRGSSIRHNLVRYLTETKHNKKDKLLVKLEVRRFEEKPCPIDLLPIPCCGQATFFFSNMRRRRSLMYSLPASVPS